MLPFAYYKKQISCRYQACITCSNSGECINPVYAERCSMLGWKRISGYLQSLKPSFSHFSILDGQKSGFKHGNLLLLGSFPISVFAMWCVLLGTRLGYLFLLALSLDEDKI